DRFSIGFSAKYIQERIWNSTASGFALDAGTYYRTPFNDLTIGAAILNFGTPMSLDGRDIQFNSDPNENLFTGPNNIPSQYNTDEFSIPMMFRVGIAMDVLDTRYTRISGSVDAVQPNDNSGYVNLGAEFAYDEIFFIRAGYKSLFMNNSEEGLTLGAGLKYKFTASFGIFINYAYEQFGRLKDVHFFDVGLLL
ncbi:MAG: PorV/PorQ family protein, partial [Melioribacteraceae bacterium]|nr:PorV/PorQ family protein [Melioribacteraceae bacterium]